MAHAKINLSRMYDWIERNLELDVPQPADAEIMELFGFDSPEQARTLLAELADAGRITIKGYGETRTIALGRVKSALMPAARPMPAAKRADPNVDAGIAKIAAIVARGPSASAARAVQASAALKAIGTTRPPVAPPEKPKPIVTPAPAPPKKEAPLMPAKSVQLPASAIVAINAIEAYAKKNDVAMGAAAAHLIEQGLVVAKPIPVPTVVATPTIATIIADLHTLFDELVDRADRPDHSDEIAALTARAETAERKLEALRAALA